VDDGENIGRVTIHANESRHRRNAVSDSRRGFDGGAWELDDFVVSGAEHRASVAAPQFGQRLPREREWLDGQATARLFQ